MIHIKKFYIEYSVVFLIAFILPVVLISHTSDIEFTDALWWFMVLQGLLVTVLWFTIRKKHAKGGHAPLVVGLYFLVLGVGMFVGSIGYKNINQYGEQVGNERLWELTNTQAGVFVVLAIVGIILIIVGLKIAFGNVYFWTWKAYLVMGVILAIIGVGIFLTILS